MKTVEVLIRRLDCFHLSHKKDAMLIWVVLYVLLQIGGLICSVNIPLS